MAGNKKQRGDSDDNNGDLLLLDDCWAFTRGKTKHKKKKRDLTYVGEEERRFSGVVEIFVTNRFFSRFWSISFGFLLFDRTGQSLLPSACDPGTPSESRFTALFSRAK